MPKVSVAMFAAAVFWSAAASVGWADWNDPTRPDNYRVSGPSGSAPVYRVSAIFTSHDRQVAVLNGRLVREGDRIGRVEVVCIEKDRVTLSVDEKTLVAALNNRRNGR